MQKRQRLRKRRDFAAVYATGARYRNNLLTLRVRRNALPESRFGFVVGKTVGGAVDRNRVKRRLREVARLADVCSGLDIVVGAHKAAAAARYDELHGALLALLQRADALIVAPGDM